MLEYEVGLKLRLKFVHVAMCSLVMSPWPLNFLIIICKSKTPWVLKKVQGQSEAAV